MTRTKDVVFTFVAAQEPAHATQLADRPQPIAPSTDQLVRISLVSGVPDDPVFRGIEDVMKRQCELHRSQCRSEMTAHLGYHRDYFFAHFDGELIQLVNRETAKVFWKLNSVE